MRGLDLNGTAYYGTAPVSSLRCESCGMLTANEKVLIVHKKGE